MTTPGIIYPDSKEQAEFLRSLRVVQQRLAQPSLREVFDYYEITGSQIVAVVKFLSVHIYLLPVLMEAEPHVNRLFGNCRVYLEIERDSDEGFEELFGVIMVNSAPEKALALLNQFDQDWFNTASRLTRGRLNFTVDTTNDGFI